MNDQHEMDEPDVFDGPPRVTNADMPEPPHPVNWNLLRRTSWSRNGSR